MGITIKKIWKSDYFLLDKHDPGDLDSDFALLAAALVLSTEVSYAWMTMAWASIDERGKTHRSVPQQRSWDISSTMLLLSCSASVLRKMSHCLVARLRYVACSTKLPEENMGFSINDQAPSDHTHDPSTSNLFYIRPNLDAALLREVSAQAILATAAHLLAAVSS